ERAEIVHLRTIAASRRAAIGALSLSSRASSLIPARSLELSHGVAIGALRLRGCVAERSNHSAQGDKVCFQFLWRYEKRPPVGRPRCQIDKIKSERGFDFESPGFQKWFRNVL